MLDEERARAERQLAEAVTRGERQLAAEQSRAAADLQAARVQAAADLEAERARHQAALGQLEQVRADLARQFEVLAQQVLEQRSQAFAQQSQTSLQTLLQPLSQQIGDFKAKVEEVYRTEGLERSALKNQVEELARLNQTLRADAQNLTEALKGSAKTRGNWGELMLGRVFEMAGLSEGTHYDVQVTHTTEDGKVLQPDVVVHLPGDRHLVIDAKVSLVAWDDFHSATDDAAREAAQRAHVESVRTHIRGLSEKNYAQLYQLGSLDFVLMFVPIESAFMLAIGRDDKLFQEAWSRNVLLVSPSTLLFVVRTVAHLWRQEDQNRNALLIADRGAALLDKFAGFAEALSGIGDKLGQAQGAYDDALTRFAGNGGLLRQTEMLRDLGVKASKPVPDKLRKRVEALGPGIASGASTLAELPLLADETGAAVAGEPGADTA
jgi:DNA recombination protein RmuC